MSYSIKDLQEKILIILKEIKRICDENNIKYILYAGTCLGAVRHKGFIPWDDDADIAMPRDEYIKFQSLCESGKLNSNFYYQDFSLNKEPHYKDAWLRIRLNNTECVIDYHEKYKYNHLGVFVDIFPIDFSSNEKHNYISKQYRKYCRVQRCFANKIAPTRFSFKSKILHFLLTASTPMKLYQKRLKIMTGMGTKNNCCCLFDFCFDDAVKKAVFDKTLFDELIDCSFEDSKFKIPLKYDEMLKQLYGNYLELPPKEKQIAHLPTRIKL